jgi:hypothetical protein
LEFNDSNPNKSNEFIKIAIIGMIKELQNRKISHVSMTFEEDDPVIPIAKELNFILESKSVYVRLDR